MKAELYTVKFIAPGVSQRFFSRNHECIYFGKLHPETLFPTGLPTTTTRYCHLAQLIPTVLLVSRWTMIRAWEVRNLTHFIIINFYLLYLGELILVLVQPTSQQRQRGNFWLRRSSFGVPVMMGVWTFILRICKAGWNYESSWFSEVFLSLKLGVESKHNTCTFEQSPYLFRSLAIVTNHIFCLKSSRRPLLKDKNRSFVSALPPLQCTF